MIGNKEINMTWFFTPRENKEIHAAWHCYKRISPTKRTRKQQIAKAKQHDGLAQSY